MDTARETRRMVRADAPLYLTIIIYTVAGLLLLDLVNGGEMAAHALYLKQWATAFLFLMPVVTLLLEAIYTIHRFESRRVLAFRNVYSPHRIACLFSGMVLLMGLMMFQGTFTSIKNVLPLFHGGFPYDQVQADIDAGLHFGTDPWRLLHAIAPADFFLGTIEWNYNVLWFVFCFGGLFFAATSPRARAVRRRYLTMFMLVWVVCGNLLAGLFLSAGPAFYGAVTEDHHRFAELMILLAESGNSSSSAHSFQNYLWSLHEAGRAGFGSGISAFPSVHVALVAMNAFFLLDISKRLGLAAFAYVGVIVASSVYLGWHYAIDGYISLVVVAALHFACKRLMPDTRMPAASAPEEDALPRPAVASQVRAS